MVTLKDFISDSQGKTFSDVTSDPRINFKVLIDFFNDPKILTRMEDSEIHHLRPPLAGVIREFENLIPVNDFLSGYDGHTTTRFRQAVGVLVKLHMLKRGWKLTGKKGSLGTRGGTKPHSTKPGAYVNKQGLAKWFTKAERYIK